MPEKNPLPTSAEEYGAVVTPVKRRITRGTEYEDEFKYTQVHIEDGSKEALSQKAKIVREGKRIFYRYNKKVPVMITPEGVRAHEDYSQKDAEEQAFFVLSMMDAEGYVSNWGKK